MNPFFSCIIPFYNRVSCLQRCIESLKGVTISNIEFIFIDDGSFDPEIEEVVAEIEKTPRFRLFRTQNSGVSAARNLGIEKSVGSHILFFDSDDYIDAKVFEAVMGKVKYSDELIITGYKKILVDEKKEYITVFDNETIEVRELLSREIRKNLDRRMFFPNWNKVYLKESLLNTRFDEQMSYGQDAVFNMQLLSNIKSVRLLDLGYYNYIIKLNNSTTTKYYPDIAEVAVNIMKSVIKLFKRLDIYDENKESLKNEIEFTWGRVKEYQVRHISNESDLNRQLEKDEKVFLNIIRD